MKQQLLLPVIYKRIFCYQLPNTDKMFCSTNHTDNPVRASATLLENKQLVYPQKNRLSVMKTGFYSSVAETGLEPVTFGL